MSMLIMLVGMALGHVLASFLQTILHRVFGHGMLDTWLKSLHTGEHHGHYTDGQLQQVRYHEDERSLTFLYLFPACLLSLACFWLMPLLLAASTVLGVFLSYAAHAYLHMQYHLTRSPLERWPVFCRLRDLHMVHHRQPDRNFAVIDLYWDVLMGTYARATPMDEAR